jgi:hypothetical protein
MSDLPDSYDSTSPGMRAIQEGTHLESILWIGNIAANSNQYFTWLPWNAVRVTCDSPLPVTYTWDDGFAPSPDITVGPFVGSLTQAFPQPYVGWLSLTSQTHQFTNPNAFNINYTVEFLRRNGTVYNSISLVVPPGGIIVGTLVDYGGPDLDKDWGPDSVIVRTNAIGPQMYELSLSTFLGTINYAKFWYEMEDRYQFMSSTTIGFPVVGCHEIIYNDNDRIRTFTRIFNYTWDEVSTSG